MRGRIPKPTALKIAEGNRGRRPLSLDREPKPPAAPKRMTAPKELTDSARAEWKRMAPVLAKMGILTEADLAALAGYCQAYGDFIDLTKRIKHDGRTVRRGNGSLATNPVVMQRNQAAEQMKAFAVEFGFTPSSRARITMDRSEDEDEASKIAKKAEARRAARRQGRPVGPG